MALKDGVFLCPVCPVCGEKLSIKYTWWAGAFLKGAVGNDFHRIYLNPGETETVVCECKCKNIWEEQVIG